MRPDAADPGGRGEFVEAVLPEEVLRLPEELARVDALLDDPVFFAPFVPFFDPRIGRPSTPMEVYLRMMFLKFRYRLGYDSLCREVVVLVATATHRANTPEELRAMFGDEVVECVRIVTTTRGRRRRWCGGARSAATSRAG
jgi:transposase, IS5 family